MTYHRSMMPGTKWTEGRKSNLDGGMYRVTRKPGPIQPISEQKPALVNRAKQVVSVLTGFGRG